MEKDFRRQLLEATQRQRNFSSEHRYTVEEFGLSRDEIFGELKDVFTEFSFER
jgi:hypothetical protein